MMQNNEQCKNAILWKSRLTDFSELKRGLMLIDCEVAELKLRDLMRLKLPTYPNTEHTVFAVDFDKGQSLVTRVFLQVALRVLIARFRRHLGGEQIQSDIRVLLVAPSFENPTFVIDENRGTLLYFQEFLAPPTKSRLKRVAKRLMMMVTGFSTDFGGLLILTNCSKREK